jgi:DNA sulfur modification protein DndD
MRFLDLSVTNIGVFRGEHTFDLSPQKQPHINHHITVITGHNGAGKTTLFRLIPLILHGSLAINERISKQAYNDYLCDLLHRHNTPEGLDIKEYADIATTIAYVQSGTVTKIAIRRSFERHGKSVTEKLTITQDGQEVVTNDPQAWLNDLIPVGLLPVCFFDAEELASLLGGSTKTNVLLKDTIRRLLGLYLVERLQADLKQYILKQGGGKDTESLREKLLQEQAFLESLDQQLQSLQDDNTDLEKSRQQLQAELGRQERRLLAEGGDYARQRPAWQKQLSEVTVNIEQLEDLLREHSTQLLPFTLVPQLVLELDQRLDYEIDLRRKQIMTELWDEKTKDVLAAVKTPSFWQNIDSSEDLRKHVAQNLKSLLETLKPEKRIEMFIHDLSSSEIAQLKNWIGQVRFGLSQHVTRLGDELRILRAKRHRLEEDLQRVPADDALTAIYKEIDKVQLALNDVHQRQLKLSEVIGKLTAKREDQFRKFEKARKDFESAKTGERSTDLAVRSRKVLHTYQDALIKHRISALEKILVEAFNQVCRKEHLLTSVAIEPDTFSVELRGVDGHTIMLDELSAGERQLYVLSLFHALRQISGYQLPLFIDTPFARLDEAHRQRLLEQYLPNVSDQVVLFATDSEEKVMHAPQAQNQIARTYILKHDSTLGETVVTTTTPTGMKSSGIALDVVHGN